MENKELKEFKEILHEVKDLDRFEKFLSHIDNVGKALDKARDSYDDAMGSYSRRLSKTFERFKLMSSGMESETPLLEQGKNE